MSGPKSYDYDVDSSALSSYSEPIAEVHPTVRERLELQDLRRQVQDQRRKLETLAAEARVLGGELRLPAEPDDTSIASLRRWLEQGEAHQRRFQQELDQLRPPAGQRRTTLSFSRASAPGQPKSAEQVLADYFAPPAAERDVAPEKSDPCRHARQSAQETIRRFHRRYPIPLPEDLDCSMQALAAAQDPKIAESLASQIREGIERLTRMLDSEREEARKLLREIPELQEEGVASVRAYLQAVADGKARLSEEDRRRVGEVRKRVRTRKAQAAAAILTQALDDLGYSVEPISETLFAEGGHVHFRSTDMGDDYFVRLRVDPREDQVNFNVVRVGASGSVNADLKTEQDWCRKLPRLLEVLATRGMRADPRRHLEPGAVPVQQIRAEDLDRDYWDRFTEERKRPAAGQKTPQTLKKGG